LPLASSFLLEYSSEYLITSTRVLVNTGSTLIQAANDEERGGGLVGQCQYCYRQHCAKRKMQVLSNTEADFEVFRPAGAARCSDRGEIVN